jgi:hypothetical protein
VVVVAVVVGRRWHLCEETRLERLQLLLEPKSVCVLEVVAVAGVWNKIPLPVWLDPLPPLIPVTVGLVCPRVVCVPTLLVPLLMDLAEPCFIALRSVYRVVRIVVSIGQLSLTQMLLQFQLLLLVLQVLLHP